MVAAVLLALGALVLSACGDSDGSAGASGEGDGSSIAGAGSMAQEKVQGHWIEGFEREEPGAKVTYDAVGSGAGRQRFIAGDAAYAASDTPLEGAELRRAVERCEPGQLVEVPAYLSKIFVAVHVGNAAFIYLTPETLARIFDGEITSWSDPEIRDANQPIAKRLNGPIRVIYPAGDSGTTANFTAYLAEAVPGVWRHGSSEVLPVPSVGTPVDSEVKMLKAIKAREGTIAFIDASLSGYLKPVLIKTGSDIGDVAVPNHGSSITTLESSPEAKELKKSPYMMPYDLKRGYGERGTYPIVFTSYLIACTAYDSDAEAAVVRGLLAYAVGSRGQEAAGTETGADPLIGDLQKRAEAAVAAIE
ncbi:MAG TPA: extracellular solute-binding protein [Solirubrobacterales bacterium]